MLAAEFYRLRRSTCHGADGGDAATPRMADTVGEHDAAFERITDRETVGLLLSALVSRGNAPGCSALLGIHDPESIAERIDVSQMRV
jgi:hypothetical protein